MPECEISLSRSLRALNTEGLRRAAALLGWATQGGWRCAVPDASCARLSPVACRNEDGRVVATECATPHSMTRERWGTQVHALRDGDGCVSELYHALWQKNKSGHSCPGVNLPETVRPGGRPRAMQASTRIHLHSCDGGTADEKQSGPTLSQVVYADASAPSYYFTSGQDKQIKKKHRQNSSTEHVFDNFIKQRVSSGPGLATDAARVQTR